MQEPRDQLVSQDTSYLSMVKQRLRRLERALAAVLLVVQISAPLPVTNWDSISVPPAEAVLYSPDTKVPRTGELALRRAIPANTNMKTIQVAL